MADDESGGAFGKALEGIGKTLNETLGDGALGRTVQNAAEAVVRDLAGPLAETVNSLDGGFEVSEAATVDPDSVVDGAQDAFDAYAPGEDDDRGRGGVMQNIAASAQQAAQSVQQGSAQMVETAQAAIAEEAETEEAEYHTEERAEEAAAQRKRDAEEAEAAADRQAAEQQQAREQQQEAHEAEMERIEAEREAAEAEAEAERDEEDDPSSD